MSPAVFCTYKRKGNECFTSGRKFVTNVVTRFSAIGRLAKLFTVESYLLYTCLITYRVV